MRYFLHTTDNVPRRWHMLQLVRANAMLFAGMIPWRFRAGHLSEDDYKEAVTHVQRGDVILVASHRRTGIFVFRGALVHALLYTGEGACIHAVGDGVETTQFATLFREYDTMVIWRPGYQETAQINSAIRYMEAKLGMPFDFGFNPKTKDAWFCTELVCSALSESRIETGICKEDTIVRAADFLKKKGNIVFHSRTLVQNGDRFSLSPKYYSWLERLLFT